MTLSFQLSILNYHLAINYLFPIINRNLTTKYFPKLRIVNCRLSIEANGESA
jgi:hypothetical protein